MLICHYIVTSIDMKLNPFNKNKKNKDMNPKEKEAEKELNSQETENIAEEQLQEETTDQEAPLTKEEELEKELEKANETIEDQKDKYLRLSAEFDNYRKRTVKEKAELILNGGEKSLSSILPVVDDLERALQTMEKATDVAAVKEGVELIEVAPGLDIEKDILAHMDFKPIIKDVKVMDERIFKDEIMGLAK